MSPVWLAVSTYGLNESYAVVQPEAQLPLRNRASAMGFFTAQLLPIAVITETYVCHVRNLRPMNRLIY